MTPAIIRFNGQFTFLSNFATAPLKVNGMVFATVEHAYQAFKATNEDDRLLVQGQQTAGGAKKAGNAIEMNDTFLERRIEIMTKLLKAKFSLTAHPTYANRLLETGTAYLVEGNNWHDNFWGDCICRECKDIIGENNLGLLLMKRRTQLKKEMKVNQPAA